MCSDGFRPKKKPFGFNFSKLLTVTDVLERTNGAKAGLEHRYYPYDIKGLKLTKLGMIPSLIPSVPTGDNRTKSILILFAYTNFDFIYIINTYIASSRI